VAISDLAYTYALAGRKQEAVGLVTQLKDMAKQKYVSPYDLAVAYVGLGDTDTAFSWLEKAYQERDEGLLLLKIDPVLDSIRSDPRFSDLLARAGLN
jgi:tetratricopeptide (TPR) repeat protein